MKDVNFNAYHATDRKCLDGILKEGFIYKPNKEHWLGNGVYFFIEYELARWWYKTEHKNFGQKIKNPIIIEVTLNVDSDNMVDFRILNDYNWIAHKYNQFINEIFEYGTPTQPINYNKLRCSFFDWISNAYKIKVVIGSFSKYKSSYLKSNLPIKFQLPYIEYQVCVYDNSIIQVCNYSKGVI